MTSTPASKQTLPGHKGGIFAVAFSPDGLRVATGCFDGQVRLFETATGKSLASFVPVPVQPTQVAAGR